MMLSLACLIVESWSSIYHDVRWPWWGSMMWFEQGWNGGDGWIPSGDVVCHARICQGPDIRSRHPRTTCVATCLIWNGLPTNYGCYGKCALLGWVGIWRSYSPRLTQCKRGRGTVTIPRNLSNAMILRTTLVKLGIWLIVNLCNDI
jgi:hypothetical protein